MPYDYPWALQELLPFQEAMTAYVNLRSRDGESENQAELNRLHNWIVANQGVPRRIIEDVLGLSVPRFASDPLSPMADAYEIQRFATEAVTLVERHEEIEEHWSSEVHIEIDADQLHPWVWNAAKDLWSSSHWGEALEASLKVINAKLQEKVGNRALSGVDLVNRAWSREDPREGQPRLRVGDPDDPQTFTNLNEGALALGQAVTKLYRNPLAHLPDQVERQHALEGLAATSAFARLIEESDVRTLRGRPPSGTRPRKR